MMHSDLHTMTTVWNAKHKVMNRQMDFYTKEIIELTKQTGKNIVQYT